MGNTLTCCVSPNASPKPGRRAGPAARDCGPEGYEAAAGDAAAVAAAPGALEPGEADLGAGEGHHLQHISDREMPEGRRCPGPAARSCAATVRTRGALAPDPGAAARPPSHQAVPGRGAGARCAGPGEAAGRVAPADCR